MRMHERGNGGIKKMENIEEQMFCEVCGGRVIFNETPQLTHYGELRCDKCHKWVKWVSNPEKVKHRTQTSKRVLKDVKEFHKMEEEFCFFCLRKREDLGQKETLTLDHIHELQNGGKDIIENMQILCTACHKLKNWTKLYMHWHFKQ